MYVFSKGERKKKGWEIQALFLKLRDTRMSSRQCISFQHYGCFLKGQIHDLPCSP